MKISRTKSFFIILVSFLSIIACNQRKERKNEENSKEPDYTYVPQIVHLSVVSKTVNPEITGISLLSDNEKDSVTAVVPENGKFELEADSARLHEVYFLKITGKSTKKGTTGLAWEELVPILATSSTTLELAQKNFNHVGSISKIDFSVQGGNAEQNLLNDWHTAIIQLKAEEDAQMEQYNIGGSGLTKLADKKKLSKTPTSVTEDFIVQHKPSIATFYLISRIGKQRQHASVYQKLLAEATDKVKASKYGLDLARRLTQIQTKITRINLKKQILATDTRLMDIPWDSLENTKYLVLYFWNSVDKTSSDMLKKLNDISPELEKKEIDVLPISMESRFSQWKENTEKLPLKYNFRMRNEAQQDLIDTLYLSALPRLILVKPNGEVINDDMQLDELEALN